jgi:hypothetical protein
VLTEIQSADKPKAYTLRLVKLAGPRSYTFLAERGNRRRLPNTPIAVVVMNLGGVGHCAMLVEYT